MNEISAWIGGIIGILFIALLPAGIGLIIQWISRKPVSLLLHAVSALILVIALFWIFDWPMVRIMNSTALSLIGSFSTTWLLIATGSRFACGLKGTNTGTQNDSEK